MPASTSAGSQQVAGAPGRAAQADGTERSWFQITIICLAMFLEGMSASSINVQVNAVRADFGVAPYVLELIASAFLVAYAGVLPASGRLADAWNRRTLFLLGVGTFGVGSLVCAAAPGPWMLVAGRALQGLGAALSAPAALALMTAGLPAGDRRNRAVALFGAMGALGFSSGLVLPSFVVTAWGWRLSFLIVLPIVLLVLAVVSRVRVEASIREDGVDLVGAAVLTAVLVVAVSTVGGVGHAPRRLLLVEAGLGVLLVVALIRRGGLHGFPSEVARSRGVLAMSIALAACFAGVVASMYALSLGLQLERDMDALAVGLAILPQPIAFGGLSWLGGRLVTRFGSGVVLAVGLAVTGSGIFALGATATGRVELVPAMVAIGAGLALVYPAASIGAVDAVPPQHHATTAGFLTTWQNVGGAVGIALLTALAVVPHPDTRSDPSTAMYVAAGLVAAGGLLAAMVGRRAGRGGGVHAYRADAVRPS